MIRLLLLSLLLILSACGAYKHNIMFRVGETSKIKEVSLTVDKEYVLANYDQITFEVYTKNGEKIIDPDAKLLTGSQNAQTSVVQKDKKFSINESGIVKLPMVGEIKLAGFTLRETEELLQKEYAKYYENVYVTVQCESRRVIVLGAPGGQVIPLVHENTPLVEVIALSKGPSSDAKVENIRLLRGEDVYLIDFSTIEGYRKGNMIVQPGDVVYIEPVRKPAVEALRDYIPFITVLSSLAVLIALLK